MSRPTAVFPIVVSPERKFHDLDIDDATIAAGVTVAQDSCNLIAQGVTETTRIGRKCTIRQINWRFDIQINAATASTGTTDIVRILLYLDRQANGATASATDILESADYQSFNNLSNKNRFRTLMDRTYEMNCLAGGGDGTTEDYGQTVTEDSFFKKVNIPVEFDSTAGAITEIKSNNIGLLTISRSGKCSFVSKMRLRFTDP